MWWSRLVFVLRVVAIVWALIVAAVLYLAAQKELTLSPGLEATGWIVSIVIIAVDNAGTLVRRKANRDLQRFHSDIDGAILPMLTQMAETQKVRFEQLGASVYRTKRRWWPSRKPQEISRLRRVRPSNFPTRNGARWTTKSGQVGASLTGAIVVYEDWHEAGLEWQKHRSRVDPRKAFNELDTHVRGDYTYEEFTAAAGRYSEIVAIPLFSSANDSKVIGVLTIDRVFEADDAKYTPFLNTRAAGRIYAGPQELIASILKPAGSS